MVEIERDNLQNYEQIAIKVSNFYIFELSLILLDITKILLLLLGVTIRNKNQDRMRPRHSCF